MTNGRRVRADGVGGAGKVAGCGGKAVARRDDRRMRGGGGRGGVSREGKRNGEQEGRAAVVSYAKCDTATNEDRH